MGLLFLLSKKNIMSELAEKLAKLKEQAVSQLNQAGVFDIDHDTLDGLVNNLRLIVDNKDAILASGSNPSELETVRRNFVVKKLGINDKETGETAIKAVAEQMSYYLVKHKLS